MEDTWAHRDLPVLNAIAAALEDQADVSAAQVARSTRIPGEDVVKAFYALERIYTGHIEAVLGGGPGQVYVSRVTAAGRRATGQWPSAESLVERLAAALDRAAEFEPEPQLKGRLRAMACDLRGAAWPIAVSVLDEMLGPQLPPEHT